MYKLKTQKNDASVEDFLNSVEDEKRRKDSFAVLGLMREVTGEEPAMWGANLIGYGSYRYRYASGHEGEWPVTGFSPRKQSLTLYIMSGFEQYESLLKNLGKYRTGKSCLYVDKLDDINLEILRALVKQSVAHMKEIYGG